MPLNPSSFTTPPPACPASMFFNLYPAWTKEPLPHQKPAALDCSWLLRQLPSFSCRSACSTGTAQAARTHPHADAGAWVAEQAPPVVLVAGGAGGGRGIGAQARLDGGRLREENRA